MAGRVNVSTPFELGSLRLEPGPHRSPSEGVCVVELASVLAGERFSDSPDCVCRVIAAYLRSWNDRASYADRQRLRPYAERVIDSRANRAVTRRRREICLLWAGLRDPSWGAARRLTGRLGARVRIAWVLGVRQGLRLNQGAAAYAARACFARYGSEAAFRLLDRLLEVGGEDEGAGRSSGVANGNGHDRADRDFIRAVLRARAGGPRQRAPVSGNGDGEGTTAGTPPAEGAGNGASAGEGAGNGASAGEDVPVAAADRRKRS